MRDLDAFVLDGALLTLTQIVEVERDLGAGKPVHLLDSLLHA